MRSGPGKTARNQKQKTKKKYSGQQQKEIDCDEPHPAPNEKTQPIRWTERPTGALVAVNSLWPSKSISTHAQYVTPPTILLASKIRCLFFLNAIKLKLELQKVGEY